MPDPMVRPAPDFDSLWSQIDYTKMEIPERFNIGVACLDVNDPTARALTVVALDRTSQDYTFGEVTEQSNRMANALSALGVRRGDRVGVINPASFETAVALMGIFRMGAVALPMSSLFGPDALRYRIIDAGARAVVVSSANAPRVREALADSPDVQIVVVDGSPEGSREHDFREVLAATSADFTPVDTRSEEPAFLIYTSGTTGDPKGALHAHRSLFGHIPGLEVLYEFYPQPGDVIWSPADWAWIAGLMDILVPAWYHGVPVVADADGAFNAERATWLLREFGVTITLIPATALRMIRASGVSGGGFALRVLMSGGEPIGEDLLNWTAKFFDSTIVEAFGQTEFNPSIGNCPSVYPPKIGALGRALPGTVVAVLDAEGNPVVDQIGELAMDRRHPSTLLQYWAKPEATAEKFHGNWLLTGDLARQDTDGYLWFESRKDDVIKSSGYRIGPGEIEGSLGAHPAVAMSAVIGVPDERRGEVPKAFVVLREGYIGDEALADALRAHVRERLAPHEVPRHIEFRDDLPKTTTGKIMRRALRDG
ncbi:MAG TPA: AMP-binding protein [Pseudonocardia sp.]|jgi:acetyl-CoA synthetase